MDRGDEFARECAKNGDSPTVFEGDKAPYRTWSGALEAGLTRLVQFLRISDRFG